MGGDRDDFYAEQRKRVSRKWTEEEVSALRAAITVAGGSTEHLNWSDIAAHVPNRTAKQCLEKWKNDLRPDISKDPWASREEYILAKAHSEVGNAWAEIARYLKGRSSNSIKNHWNATIRAKTGARVKSFLWMYSSMVLEQGQSPASFEAAIRMYEQSMPIEPLASFQVPQEYFDERGSKCVKRASVRRSTAGKRTFEDSCMESSEHTMSDCETESRADKRMSFVSTGNNSASSQSSYGSGAIAALPECVQAVAAALPPSCVLPPATNTQPTMAQASTTTAVQPQQYVLDLGIRPSASGPQPYQPLSLSLRTVTLPTHSHSCNSQLSMLAGSAAVSNHAPAAMHDVPCLNLGAPLADVTNLPYPCLRLDHKPNYLLHQSQQAPHLAVQPVIPSKPLLPAASLPALQTTLAVGSVQATSGCQQALGNTMLKMSWDLPQVAMKTPVKHEVKHEVEQEWDCDEVMLLHMGLLATPAALLGEQPPIQPSGHLPASMMKTPKQGINITGCASIDTIDVLGLLHSLGASTRKVWDSATGIQYSALKGLRFDPAVSPRWPPSPRGTPL